MAGNIITTTNTFAQFSGPNIWQAKEVLSFRQKGYQFSRAYKRGQWDGTVHLMRQDGRFAAGLMPWLVERLSKEGIEVVVNDRRPEPLPVDNRLADIQSTVESWPHQSTAIEEAMRLERGVIWHPTAAGKTVVMGEIIRRVARPALVLVHRKDLMYQTAERFVSQFAAVGRNLVGVIGDGRWEPRLVTVATFQTLHLRLKERAGIEDWLRQEIGQVHVDEAHHLPAKSYEHVMAQMWSARWRLGYSATPFRSGDQETFFRVASWLGPTIHRAFADELAEQGHLVPADIFMIRMRPQPVTYRRWPEAVRYGIVENEVRNGVICDLARRLHRTGSGPVVVLVERLAHGERLADELGCPFLAGDAPTNMRQQAWNAMRRRDLNLLVTSKIADEGLDIPPLTYLIMAGGGKAPYLTVQRVGRGMRTASEKERLFVFDFLDTGKYLAAHARRRLQTYQEQPAYTVSEVEVEEVLP